MPFPADQPIVFMGTPDFAVPTLRAMLEAGFPVVAVVCQPDRPTGRGQKLAHPPVKALALEVGLPVFQPERIRRNPEFLATMAELKPALFVVIAYGRILPPELLALPTHGCLNLHASLLPAYRGAAPIQWSVIRGETMTGTTLMVMEEGLDTGPMLAKATVEIGPDDTSATLSPRLAAASAALAVAEIPRWVAGKLPPVAQDDALSTLAPMLSRETGRLDFSRPARELRDLVRGTQPWPGASTTLLGQVLKVGVPDVLAGPADAAPGTVLALHDDGWHIATGDGVLVLTTVQVPGKPMRSAADVARGWRELVPGVVLGEAVDVHV